MTEEVYEDYCNKCGFSKCFKQPALAFSKPISLDATHMPDLDKERHNFFVSPKYDGERFQLFFTTVEGENTTFAISATFDVIKIGVACKQKFFKGMLLDGELVGDTFFAFDILVCNGIPMRRTQYWEYRNRYTVLAGIVPHVNIPSDCDESARIKGIKLKPNFRIGDETSVISHPNIACDGIIFTPLSSPVEVGRSQCIMKWKSSPTIDLQVFNGTLFCTKDNSGKLERYAPSLEVICNVEDVNDGIVEFGMSLVFIMEEEEDSGEDCKPSLRLTSFRQRDDKDFPNTQTVCRRTLDNIMNPIKREELDMIFPLQEWGL